MLRSRGGAFRSYVHCFALSEEGDYFTSLWRDLKVAWTVRWRWGRSLAEINRGESGRVSGGASDSLPETMDRRFEALRAARHGLFWALTLAHVLMAAAPAQEVRALRHQAWSVEEGLPQNSVHALLQSRDGYLWIGTEGGVARFDGGTFRVFGHASEAAFSSDDICCIAEDGAGTVWFGTTAGLVRVRGGVFRGWSEGPLAAAVLSLTTDERGGLLVLNAAGLVRVDAGEHVTPVATAGAGPALTKVVAVARSGAGPPLLVGEGGVFRMEGGVAKVVDLALPEGFSAIQDAAQGPRGELWVRSSDGVLLQAGGRRRVWRVGRELPGGRVESLMVDRGGTAWVGTNEGLVTLRGEEGTVTPVHALDGFAVLSLLEDREGNLWAGTEAAGLHALRRLTFRTEAALADRALTAVVATADGDLWVGTREDGVRRLRNDVVEEPAPVRALTSPVVLSLAAAPAGGVWVGTPDGLNRVGRDGSVRQITSADGLPDDDVRSLAAEADGAVWIGTRRGLAHLRGTTIRTLTRADGLGGDLIGTLLETRGEGAPAGLWVGTSGGVSLVQGGRVRTFTERDGLPGLIATGMAQDETGALWVATAEGGLSRFGGDGRFHPVPGLAAGGATEAIAADGRGSLWLRDARGVRRASVASLVHCTEVTAACPPRVAQYGLADGLPSEEAVAGASPAVALRATGELWFATRRGLAVADVAHLTVNAVPPPVVIERFVVDDAELPMGPGELAIPFGHARFTMEYAGLSYTVPSKTRYRFRLEGFDREWTNAGARRAATYTNLPPGRYRFRVQAMNNDGVWSERDAELRFRIVPPYYRRWWFALVALLLLAAIVSAIYRLRLRNVQRRFDAVLGERNRIAREIHDTLAQDFVGVSIQLEIVSQLLGMEKVGAAREQVERTRSLVRDGLADARQSIWELRANTAESSLPTRIARVAERYGSGTTAVRVKIGGAYRPLEAPVENGVVRIAQEALSNVERHAGATEVEVELAYGRETLVLAITDNGRGFATETAARMDGHYGLRGMQERAAEMHGRLELGSEPGRGARVALTISINTRER